METRTNLNEVGKKKLVLGIDVALKNHWAAIGDNKGQEMVKPFQFTWSQVSNATPINFLKAS